VRVFLCPNFLQVPNMPRIVKAPNGHYSLDGLSLRDGRPTLYKDPDDDVTVVIDWSRVLGSATIDTIENTGTGITVDNASNTTTTSTFNVYGTPTRNDARVNIKATLDDGQVITERLNVIERDL